MSSVGPGSSLPKLQIPLIESPKEVSGVASHESSQIHRRSICIVSILVGLGCGVCFASGYVFGSRSTNNEPPPAPGPSSSSLYPAGFVSIHDFNSITKGILLDIRYYTPHNFMGRRVEGYNAPLCILTEEAASALSSVQEEVVRKGLTLKVYDCYRPQRAVNDFINWSQNPFDTLMKEEFYSNVNKTSLFPQYIATKSGHSRGSTLDVTLVPLNQSGSEVYHPGQPLYPCYAPLLTRFHDDSIDMGCGFDCFNDVAHTNASSITEEQRSNRKLLVDLMDTFGFDNYDQEFWHFTLREEPFPDTYFDFTIHDKEDYS